jgi:catechol 2,3-dioxygenase-like lactoylglutathione lyase family enzyme
MTDPAPFESHEFTGVGLVVNDVTATVRAYANLLGVSPWRFFDVDLETGDGAESVRVATACLGRLTLELIQPLAGYGVHRRFLDRHGNGVHHVSFGNLENCDQLVESAGLSISTQAEVGNGTAFTYLDTQPSLATCLQLSADGGAGPNPWGTYVLDAVPAVDLSKREIVQLGIVVDDVAETAAQYTRLLGVTNWRFLEFQAPADWHGVFKDVPANDAGFHIKAAIAWHGAMQIELLEPVSGTSTHMDFLRAQGSGIHHMSFDVIDDHDSVRNAFNEAGIGTEMGGELGPDVWFTYLDTRDCLGTIFEIVRQVGGAGRRSLV